MIYPSFTNPPEISPITGERNTVISSHQSWQQWWVDTTPKLTTLVSWMQGINNNVENKAIEVEHNKIDSYNARDRAESARDRAVSAQNAIEEYVIPEGVTYSKEEIDNIVEDMLYSIILNVKITISKGI